MEKEEYLELLQEARQQFARSRRNTQARISWLHFQMCSKPGFLTNWLNHHQLMFELERELEEHSS
jgi:hypothetical protein